MNLKLEDVAAQRSFVFLWCGSCEGLDIGREEGREEVRKVGERGGRREGGKCEQINFISIYMYILQTKQHEPKGECCPVWGI